MYFVFNRCARKIVKEHGDRQISLDELPPLQLHVFQTHCEERTTWVPPSARKRGRTHMHTKFGSHLDFPFFSFLRLGLGADLQPRRLDIAEVRRGDEVGAERAADGDGHVAQHHLNDAGFFAQPAVFGWGSGNQEMITRQLLLHAGTTRVL